MKNTLPLSLRVSVLRQGSFPEYGKKYENGKIRYVYTHDVVRVTDLTNAGKRGKRVDTFTLDRLDVVSGNSNESKNHNAVFQNVMKFVSGLEKLDYAQAFKWGQLIIKDTKQRGLAFPQLSTDQLMGHTVLPSGFAPISFSNDSMSVHVTLNDFTISDLSDQHNMPRCINTGKGGKSGPAKLYKWLSQNLEKAKKMSYHDLTGMLSKLGVRSHSYCAMD